MTPQTANLSKQSDNQSMHKGCNRTVKLLLSPQGQLLLGPRGREGLAQVLSTQFYTNGSFDLSQNNLVRNTSPSFVIIYNLRLLTNFSSQVFLAPALGLSPLHDELSDIQWNFIMLQLFCLSVKFCCIFCCNSVLILTTSPFLLGIDCHTLSTSSIHSISQYGVYNASHIDLNCGIRFYWETMINIDACYKALKYAASEKILELPHSKWPQAWH